MRDKSQTNSTGELGCLSHLKRLLSLPGFHSTVKGKAMKNIETFALHVSYHQSQIWIDDLAVPSSLLTGKGCGCSSLLGVRQVFMSSVKDHQLCDISEGNSVQCIIHHMYYRQAKPRNVMSRCRTHATWIFGIWEGLTHNQLQHKQRQLWGSKGLIKIFSGY